MAAISCVTSPISLTVAISRLGEFLLAVWLLSSVGFVWTDRLQASKANKADGRQLEKSPAAGGDFSHLDRIYRKFTN
jgi:hypothetical protein